MKNYIRVVKILIVLFLVSGFALLPPAARAAEDCPKNTDACAAGAKKTLPFMAAAAAAEEKAKAPAAVKPLSASKPAAAAWLLFIGAAIAGLYYYLRGNSRKRKK